METKLFKSFCQLLFGQSSIPIDVHRFEGLFIGHFFDNDFLSELFQDFLSWYFLILDSSSGIGVLFFIVGWKLFELVQGIETSNGVGELFSGDFAVVIKVNQLDPFLDGEFGFFRHEFNESFLQLKWGDAILFVGVSLFENFDGIDFSLPPFCTHVFDILLQFFVFHCLFGFFLDSFGLFNEEFMTDITIILWIKGFEEDHLLILIQG